MIVEELPTEYMRVAGAVAGKAIVRIVVVDCELVEAKATVLTTKIRSGQIVVNPNYRRFAITDFDERWWQMTVCHLPRVECPNSVGILRCHQWMEAGSAFNGTDGHDIALLGEEFLPPLMGKKRARRTAFHRSIDAVFVSQYVIYKCGPLASIEEFVI